MGRRTKYGVRGDYEGIASDHPLYYRWMNMLRRCYEPTFHGYKSYGGRGVTVEPFLQNFTNYVNFVSSLEHYDDLISSPNDWQIDKDVNGGDVYSRKTLQIIRADHNLEVENSKRRMPVFQVTNNNEKIFYESITAAEQKTGVWRGNIARAVKRGYTAGGCKWERAQ